MELTEKEREFIVSLLKEKGNESYECATGNWMRDPPEVLKKELYAESELCYELIKKLQDG